MSSERGWGIKTVPGNGGGPLADDLAEHGRIAHIEPAEFGREDPEGPLCGCGHDAVAEEPELIDTTIPRSAQEGIVQPIGRPIRVSTQRGFSFPFACVWRFSPPCRPWFPAPVVQFAWGDAQYRGLS